MSHKFITVQNKGIFHSLPTFPEHDGKKYTAIVTGANGVSGSHIVDVLAEAPERWSTIYAMSRRAPASTRSNVKNVAADFLAGTPEELAELFKKQGVTA
jgi:nucleoside-diphosphate-sugar epimerase